MPDKSKNTIQESETVSPEIVSFCALLARIMMRCLREKNPQVMQLLSASSQQGLETGETHDPA